MGRREPAERAGPFVHGEPGLSHSDSSPLGVVLAGGRSRRLGGAKAALLLAGKPLITHPLAALAAAGLETVVVAKADSELPELDVPIWIEKPEHRHPAHGIATALERADGPIVACACDTPFLRPALLSLLAGRDRPLIALESGRGLEPLPGRYSPEFGAQLARAARRGEGLRAAVGQLKPELIGETELRRFGDPDRILLNVNTAEDLAQAEAIAAT